MILVTGATGFLGSFICRQLLKEDRPFIAMKRANSSLSLLSDVESQIEWLEADIADTDTLENTIPKINTVIHSAAVISFQPSDRKKLNRINIEGTKNLVNLCLQNDVERFIHISSVGALGRNTKKGAVDEKNKWQNSKWNTYYGESKYLAELEVWRGHVEGLNAAILCPSVILGPGDWDKGSSAIFKYVWDENKFYTDGLLNYVDVRDVTSVISKLLDNTDKFGERYIVNAGTVTFNDFFQRTAAFFNKKAPSTKANSFLIRLSVFAEWLKHLVSGKQQMITRETARTGQSQIYFDNTKVVNELNHTFVPLSETLEWSCSHYMDNKK